MAQAGVLWQQEWQQSPTGQMGDTMNHSYRGTTVSRREATSKRSTHDLIGDICNEKNMGEAEGSTVTRAGSYRAPEFSTCRRREISSINARPSQPRARRLLVPDAGANVCGVRASSRLLLAGGLRSHRRSHHRHMLPRHNPPERARYQVDGVPDGGSGGLRDY